MGCNSSTENVETASSSLSSGESLSPIVWSPDIETKVELIDSQHKALAGKINKLVETFDGGAIPTPATFGPLLDDTIQFTAFHFACEEELQRVSEYPEADSQAHIEAHRSHVALVKEYRAGLGSVPIRAGVVAGLCEWVGEHIMGHDKPFGAFLREKYSEGELIQISEQAVQKCSS